MGKLRHIAIAAPDRWKMAEFYEYAWRDGGDRRNRFEPGRTD
jgi:hypothetical protein